MEHLSVYVRLRPTEEEHLIRPEDNRLVINDELLFNAQSVLVNASQVRILRMNFGIDYRCNFFGRSYFNIFFRILPFKQLVCHW